jgi:parvulin-like peptidyl-prolyl isomerase
MHQICSRVGPPDEEQIEKYYRENVEQFTTAEQIRVAHIVKHINWQMEEKEAYEVISRAKQELAGGASFESLVGRFSDCPDNGGDLGYISRGQMVEEFDDVVFNLAVGQVSGIFRTRFGFHIARVYDRKPASVRSLDEVREYAQREVKKQMQTDAIHAFIDQLKEKADIKEV